MNRNDSWVFCGMKLPESGYLIKQGQDKIVNLMLSFLYILYKTLIML